jgi:hypothetical protein
MQWPVTATLRNVVALKKRFGVPASAGEVFELSSALDRSHVVIVARKPRRPGRCAMHPNHCFVTLYFASILPQSSLNYWCL